MHDRSAKRNGEDGERSTWRQDLDRAICLGLGCAIWTGILILAAKFLVIGLLVTLLRAVL
jgi:hypothetical protein